MTYTLLSKNVTARMYNEALEACENHLAARSRLSDVTQEKLTRAGLRLLPQSGNPEATLICRSIAREKSYSGALYSTIWQKPIPVPEVHLVVSSGANLWRSMAEPRVIISRILEHCGYRGESLLRFRDLSTHFRVNDHTHEVEFIVGGPEGHNDTVHCLRMVLTCIAADFAVQGWMGSSFGMIRELVARCLAPAGVSIDSEGKADLLVLCPETEFLPPSTPTGLDRVQFLDLLQGQTGQGDIYFSGRDLGQQCRELANCRGLTCEAFYITPDGYCGPEDFEGNPVLKLMVISVLFYRNAGYFSAGKSHTNLGYGTEKKRMARLETLAKQGNKAVAHQLSRRKAGSHVEAWARVIQRVEPELSKQEVVLTCDNILKQISKLPPDFQFQVFGASPDRVRGLVSPFVVRETPVEEVATV